MHRVRAPIDAPDQAGSSAVSWSAVLAGAAGAAALSLILLILGTGLGLSSVSPFSGRGLGAAALGVSTIAWLSFTQLAASGIGGYLAGRLRTRWHDTQADEVYFRDTAHGFLAWGVATLATAAMLTSAVGSIVGGGTQAAASVAGGAAATAAVGAVAAGVDAKADGSADPTGYFVDTLFRRDANATAAAPAPMSAPDGAAASGRGASTEAGRILVNALASGSLPPEDATYLGQLVAQRTGLPPAEAQKRVTDTFARAQAKAKSAEASVREAADKARKASSYTALWLFISLLLGAFVASLAATYGGRRRDL
ncbi:MAG: hypothetical protein H7Y33_19355 [Cytophagales bacterium]|nr:hypothetical protein [Rhizobacter sp.]